MALGALPYHARVTQATPLPSGDFNLQITVTDNSSNVLQITSMTIPAGSIASGAISTVLDGMEDIVATQMLSDAGSFAAAALALSVEVGE